MNGRVFVFVVMGGVGQIASELFVRPLVALTTGVHNILMGQG